MQPEKIGRYQIKSELGHGGMGTVYLGYDPRSGREVAVKVLLPELLQSNPEFRFRFVREAKIIANLELPSIVPVYDVDEENDQPYFVMRYMRGGSLAEKIKTRTYGIEETLRILQQLAPGIDEAHAKGIVHRDLKPGNVLFDSTGVPYISDFGIAKLIESHTGNTTGGAVVGTPAYMSPEQKLGKPVDGRTDIYALGVILYEMLTGRQPYEREYIPASQKTNIPIWMDGIISMATAEDRDERFSTAVEMIDFLKAVMRGDAPPAPKRKAKNKRFYLLATITSLFIVSIIGSLIFFRNLPTQTPTPEATTVTSETVIEATEALLVPTEVAVTEPPAATDVPIPTPSLPVIGGADKIAFLNNNNIWVMNVDGDDLQPVTNDKEEKFNVEWLPDGKNILYITGKTIKTVNIDPPHKIETITSFSASDYFESFHVSPDGKQVAISLARELHVVPFNPEKFENITKKSDLLEMKGCIFYNSAEVKNAVWSNDGEKLTIKFSTLVGKRTHYADTLRVIDIQFCNNSKPRSLDEFPASRFTFSDTIVNFDWDGNLLFFLNSDRRNDGFGDLLKYNYHTHSYEKIAPIENNCCYRDAIFSPDGNYVIFAFQDIRLAPEGPIGLYYIPVDSLTTNAPIQPIPFLPDDFFAKRNDAPMPALRPAQK